MDAITKLLAVEEIKVLKARYFRGIDTKDIALLDSVFADDVEFDARGAATDTETGINAIPSTTDVVIHGRGAVIAGLQAAIANIRSVHHGHMPEIEILDPAHARGIWSMFDSLHLSANGKILEMVGFGHYFETYVRIDQHWKIQSLRLERLRLTVRERGSQ
jgi:hypothetical protein